MTAVIIFDGAPIWWPSAVAATAIVMALSHRGLSIWWATALAAGGYQLAELGHSLAKPMILTAVGIGAVVCLFAKNSPIIATALIALGVAAHQFWGLSITEQFT